jgi:hypothetical protein
MNEEIVEVVPYEEAVLVRNSWATCAFIAGLVVGALGCWIIFKQHF